MNRERDLHPVRGRQVVPVRGRADTLVHPRRVPPAAAAAASQAVIDRSAGVLSPAAVSVDRTDVRTGGSGGGESKLLTTKSVGQCVHKDGAFGALRSVRHGRIRRVAKQVLDIDPF